MKWKYLLHSLLLLTIYLCEPALSFSQVATPIILKQSKRTSAEKQSHIIRKYEATVHYDYESLILRQDGTYKRCITDCTTDLYSEGNWTIKHHILTLNSKFQNDNLPVILTDTTTGEYIHDIPVAIIQTLQGQDKTPEVLLNDSVRCIPGGGAYYSEAPRKIVLVKVIYQYGVSSPTIPIPENTTKIALKVLTEARLDNYVIMQHVQYRMKGQRLIPIKTNQ
ncbi:hypothetical protein [Chitinophaga sp. Cy-1792]|uniref:hypothetical protein n=1 Tax=Chitinophaga sp. Cy-1792 TaxID=2608339 RepID=UPI001423ED54|nr:hypothetical protein [Chitinophaga sp. Cy-1792]NIG53590.1 hypothetical protein [Chitinophaga sp. Cy-1792]